MEKFDALFQYANAATSSDRIYNAITFRAILKKPGININNHMYSKKCLEKIAEQFKNIPYLIGENEPPGTPVTEDRVKTINLMNAGVKYTNIRMEDDCLVADCEAIGEIVPKLINEEIKHSFALRAFGEFEIDGDGHKWINPETLKVVTFDITFNPELIWPVD